MKKEVKNSENTNKLGLVPTSNIPVTDFFGYVKIGDTKIPCAVLYPESENPIRVFIQREVVGLLTGNKKGGFDRYLQPKNLQPFIPDKFKDKSFSDTTMLFKTVVNSRTAQGFVASDIIDICKMYMQADKKDVLLPNQKHLAERAEVIVFAFAKTGVDGVIDDVTGFDKVRPRFALNNLVQKYVSDEIKQYIRQFPDEFYRLIFKLNGWAFDDESIKKRPGVVGRWTNDIIYSRFPKGVLGKIQEKNPIIKSTTTDKGYRKHKNYKFLTENIGLPELQQYISNAIFLMKSCANWSKFKRALARTNGMPYDGDLFED